MDLGLIIFISCIVVLGLVIFIFHLFNKKIVQNWWKKRKDETELKKLVKKSDDDISEEEDEETEEGKKRKKKKKKKDKEDKEDKEDKGEEEKKSIKKVVTKQVNVAKPKKLGGSISYWKFILAISASLILSFFVVYGIIILVKVSFDFNLISYILT